MGSSLREYKPLNQRTTENKEIHYTKKYYFVFEGSNTEVEYFKGIDRYSKQLEISNMIEIIILEKGESIKNNSAPIRLLQEAKNKKEELIDIDKFDESVDEFVIVFDRDSFKPVDKKQKEYLEFILEAKKYAILAVTSPCFEIWLLLHFHQISIENVKKQIKRTDIATLTAFEKYYEEFRQNIKISNKHTFTSNAFSLTSGINSKSNLNFDDLLLDKVEIAINQEHSPILETDINKMVNKLGSNIGQLIELLKIDPRENAN